MHKDHGSDGGMGSEHGGDGTERGTDGAAGSVFFFALSSRQGSFGAGAVGSARDFSPKKLGAERLCLEAALYRDLLLCLGECFLLSCLGPSGPRQEKWWHGTRRFQWSQIRVGMQPHGLLHEVLSQAKLSCLSSPWRKSLTDGTAIQASPRQYRQHWCSSFTENKRGQETQFLNCRLWSIVPRRDPV